MKPYPRINKALAVLLGVFLISGMLQAKDAHYLTLEQAPDSLILLPPPPAFDSISFLSDKAQYDVGKALRSTARGTQAYEDADVSKDSLTRTFSSAFGQAITAQQTPALYELIATMKEDAGDYATQGAKKYYNRVRPFSFFNEPTCRPEDEAKLSTNGSYPSGHTTIGWAVALVLAEVNPERQDQILKRGFDIGQSRVICGYHWQSDIDAARVMASSVVATLHTNPAFVAQLGKAKQEFRQLAAGK